MRSRLAVRLSVALLALSLPALSLPALSLPGAGEAWAQDGPDTPRRNVLQEIGDAVQEVAGRVRPSVVEVVVERTFAMPPARPTKSIVISSGIVWDDQGHVVSLGGVFETADAATVVFATGERRSAEIVGVDEATGIALLRVDTEGLEGLRPAPLGSSAGLRAGSIVVQIGNAFGLSGSVAVGTVAGTGRVVKRGEQALTNVLQITTPVNPGDPGAALVDASGQVVGVVASAYERGLDTAQLLNLYKGLLRLGEEIIGRGQEEGSRPDEEPVLDPRFAGRKSAFGGQAVGFAIPIDQVRQSVERLSRKEQVERGWLGVQVIEIDPVLKSQLDLAADQGILVVGVVEDGPAAKAGLRRHDIVLGFGGTQVTDLKGFKRLLDETPPGQAIPVDLLRGGARLSVAVTLSARPKRR